MAKTHGINGSGPFAKFTCRQWRSWSRLKPKMQTSPLPQVLATPLPVAGNYENHIGFSGMRVDNVIIPRLVMLSNAFYVMFKSHPWGVRRTFSRGVGAKQRVVTKEMKFFPGDAKQA